jgi:hypothetical protein
MTDGGAEPHTHDNTIELTNGKCQTEKKMLLSPAERLKRLHAIKNMSS